MRNYSSALRIILARIKYELREGGKAAGYAMRK
jgi:hypothetical protein